MIDDATRHALEALFPEGRVGNTNEPTKNGDISAAFSYDPPAVIVSIGTETGEVTVNLTPEVATDFAKSIAFMVLQIYLNRETPPEMNLN